MTRIVFVEDNPRELAHLQQTLQRFSQQWEVRFATTPAELFAWLKQPCDAVVVDLEAHNALGTALLEQVQKRHPSVIRIGLAETNHQDQAMHVSGLVHRFLAKPCDPELLQQTIATANLASGRADAETLGELIGSLQHLPTLPDVYAALVEELQSPNASVARAGEIIAGDVSISAKILQLVNSSYFGLPMHVSDISHAVALLGLKSIKPLVLSTGLFEQFQPGTLGRFSLAGFVDHSMEVALAARCIAQLERAPAEVCDDAFLAGLLHDLGHLVLAQNYPAHFDHIRETAEREQLPIVQLEVNEFQANHADLGAYMLSQWGIPESICQAVAWHHWPEESPDTSFTAVAAVHVAECLLDEEQSNDYEQATLSHDFLARIGRADRLDAWGEALGAPLTVS